VLASLALADKTGRRLGVVMEAARYTCDVAAVEGCESLPIFRGELLAAGFPRANGQARQDAPRRKTQPAGVTARPREESDNVAVAPFLGGLQDLVRDFSGGPRSREAAPVVTLDLLRAHKAALDAAGGDPERLGAVRAAQNDERRLLALEEEYRRNPEPPRRREVNR
jgi:hypothetical protein